MRCALVVRNGKGAGEVIRKSFDSVLGLVAAPVFRTIAERALSYLGVEPDPVLLQQEKEESFTLAKAGRN